MAKSLVPRVRGFLSDRRGSVAVITAVALTAMLGAAGLGTEATMWYVAKRNMQGAADAAAFTAASAEAAGQNSTNFTLAGQAVTAQWGFTNGTDQVVVAVNNPPLSGNYTSNGQAVEVVVTQPQQMLFSRFFMASAPNISARAVAVPATSSGNCIMALDGSSTTSGLTASGGTTINATGCNLDVNASGSNALNLSGSVAINVESASIVGTYTPAGGATITATDGVTTGASATHDPYSGVNIPTSGGTCTKSGSQSGHTTGTLAVPGGQTVTLSPPTAGGVCTIDGAIAVAASTGTATLNLQPGVYIVEGSMSLSNSGTGSATISGTGGVTVILTRDATGSAYGSLNQTGGSLNLTAPTSGTTSGIAIYQDRAAPSTTGNTLSGTSTTQSITGAMYFPSAGVTFGGNSANSGANCTQLIAYTLTLSGTMSFNSRCSGTGVSGMSSGGTTLVE